MAYTKHGWHIKGTPLVDRPKGLLTARCGGPGVCEDCSKDAVVPFKLEVSGSWEVDPAAFITREPIPKEIQNEPLNDYDAICKVYDAMWRAGLSGPQIVAALNEMDRAGVIFRLERG